MDALERAAVERLGSANELMESLDASDEEIIAPTTVGREILEWMDFKETGLTLDELPRPTLWRVLIFPKQPKKMSAGGIALPGSVQSIEKLLNNIGQVVALGPLAGKSPKFENPDWLAPPPTLKAVFDGMMEGESWEQVERKMAPAPVVPRYLWDVKVGDWVIYGKYSGQHTEYKSTALLMCNDDDITQVITSPEGFKVFV